MSNISSVAFDGVNGRITIPDNSFDGLAAGTIELWFKTSYKAAYQKLVKKDSVIDIGMTQDFGGGAKVFGEISGVGNLGELEEHDYADGAWHHLALSWDGSFLRGYIDGVYKKRVAQSGSQANNANTLYIGYTGSGEPLNGKLDEFCISNIARYTTEGTFSIQTDDFSSDGNTLALLHLNDNTGTNASDDSGNGNDGTLAGGSSWDSDVPYPGSATTVVQDVIDSEGIIPFER